MRISDWSSDVCSSDLDHAGCGVSSASSVISSDAPGYAKKLPAGCTTPPFAPARRRLFALLRPQPGLGLRVGGGQVQGQGVMPDIEQSADRAGGAVEEAEREAEHEYGGAGRFPLEAETRSE